MFVRSINGSTHTSCDALLDDHYRLRARIFSQRMEWDVHVEDGLEKDAFDALDPTYILALTDDGRLAGCARLLPATGPTMLAAMFPDLVQSQLLRPHTAMIESSRFCVVTSLAGGRAKGLLHEATMTMFAGIIEWSVENGYNEIVTGTDLRVERILKRAGWPMKRLGEPRQMGTTMAVAGSLPADRSSFERVRRSST